MFDKIFYLLFYIIIITYFFTEKLYKFNNLKELIENSVFILLFFLLANKGPTGWELILLLVVILVFFNNKVKEKNIFRFSLFSIGIVIVYSLFLLIFIKYPVQSLQFILNIIKYFLGIYLVIKLINDKNNFRRLLKVIIYLAIFNIVISMGEIITGNHLSNSATYLYMWDKSLPTSYFYNINNFGCYLVMMIPFIYHYFTEFKNNIIIIIFLYMYILGVLFLVRADMLIVIAVIEYIAILIGHKLLNLNNYLRAFYIIVFIMIGVTIVYIGIEKSLEYNLLSENNNSMNVRYMVWIKGLEILKENFWGIGFDTFRYYDLTFNSAILGINKFYGLKHMGFPIHNFFLDILVSCGIGSFLFFISYIKNFLCILTQNSQKNFVKNVYVFSFLSFFIVAISSATIVISPVFWCWYIGIIGYMKYFLEIQVVLRGK